MASAIVTINKKRRNFFTLKQMLPPGVGRKFYSVERVQAQTCSAIIQETARIAIAEAPQRS